MTPAAREFQLRKTRVLIAAAAVMLLTALVALQTAPVREYVLRRVIEVVRASYGIEVRSGSLSYNVLTLSAQLRGVELASVDTPSAPFATADTLGVTFGARTLIGDVQLRRVSLVAPRISIARYEDGTDNLPRVSGGVSNGNSFALPPIAVDDLGVSFRHPAMSASIQGASVRLISAERGKITASIAAHAGLRMTIGDRTIDMESAAGEFDFEGQRLVIREVTASRPGTLLRARGSVSFREDPARVDVTVSGSSEIESWTANHREKASAVGHVEATAHVTGPVSEPTITFEADGRTIEWSNVKVGTMRASGTYNGGQLSLNTFTMNVAGGTVDGHGTISVDDPRRQSRVEVRWADVDAGQIPSIAALAGRLSKSGSTIVEWRSEKRAPPRFNIRATTGLVASGTTTVIDARGSGQGDLWHVEIVPRDSKGVDLSVIADIRLDKRRWQTSPIRGRLVMRTIDLPLAIRQAQALGAPTSVHPDSAAGVIQIDAAIEGTLGALRSKGRITGRSVTLAGLPQSDIDAPFVVDVARKTSSGTFRLLASDLSSITLTSSSGLTLGGSLTAAGSWSGPWTAPILDTTVTGRDLTGTSSDPPAVTATNGALDLTLGGPLDDLSGGGRFMFESVRVSGQEIGNVESNLAVSAGVMRMVARAPQAQAALDASIGLEAPNPFDGRLTITDYQIRRLGEAMGVAAADASSLRGRISSSLLFKGELRNVAAVTLDLKMAPVDATVFDVPIALHHGLRATLIDGRLQLDDQTMVIGGVEVRADGTVAIDRPEGKLVVDLDGDIGTLQPWLRRANGLEDWAATGRIAGHVQAERVAAGIALTGNLKSTLAAISIDNKTVAQDVRLAIDLTGQRAEVREATGRLLGGELAAAGGAPLHWLNKWLPSGWQIAPPQIDAPATLEATAWFNPATLLGAFGGALDVSAKLTSSRPDLMAVIGEVRFDRAEVTTKGLTYAQADVTRFRLSEGALTVESLDWRGPGTKVLGRGSLGFAPGVVNDVRLDVDTELAIIGTLLSGRATGRLEGNVELRGPYGAPRLTADASMTEASWLVPGQRILFAGWSGRVRLTDEDLSIAKFGGRVNGGTVNIDGQLPLRAQGSRGGLTITARDILIDVPRGLRSQLGADLIWRQSEIAPTLQGAVQITSNEYTEPVTRILQLVNSLSAATRRSGESTLPPWLARTALDIDFDVTDPILIDNSAATVELLPDLQLGGTVDSPSLSGRVAIVDDGRVQIGGRAYRLRDSLLRFAPAEGLLPTLDVLGETRIGEYEVTIRISGTADRIETNFSSVPPLGERELQSLVVTGRADDQSIQGNDADNFAAGAAATDILGFAGKFVGLDSVRVGAADLELVNKDVSNAQHLTVQKSLGSKFDLIFSENLEEGSVTWVLVWKPTTANEIRASSMEDGTRTLEFRRSLVFGPGTPSVTASVRSEAKQPSVTVNAVRITGTPGFSDREIVSRLELEAGDRFDVRRWIEDRHRLEEFYLESGYHRVRIVPTRLEDASRMHVSLTYDIQRGPRTVIETSGDSLPGEMLDAMYEAWRGLPIADVVKTEFERIAREGLAQRGFYRPTVELAFPPETPDLARVTMRVSRGPQIKQLKVAWRGVPDASVAELDGLLEPHRAESEVWLDTQALAWDVRQWYASRGYVQTVVTVGEPTFDDADVTLPIAIDEGVLSRLADLRIEGVDPTRMATVQEALGLTIGEPLAESASTAASRRVKALYMGLGYRSAAVTHDVTTAKDGSVSIALRVTEGPLHVVKDVNVVGVVTTNAGLVQNAI
ncbi:MAG TPA: translocation/assembly module TamB domain-containing protein, partial [Vicinamibacterales bacterium]